MITVNSLSGGKTSSYVASNYKADLDIFALVRIEDKNCEFPDKKLIREIEDRIQAPFIATAEDDTIIYTMLDLEQHIGRKITWVTGMTFEESIDDRGGYLPNKIARYCTTFMKTFPIAEYLYKNDLNPVSMRFGYRANEVNRMKTMLEKTNEEGVTEVKIKVGRKNNRNVWKTIQYAKPEFPLIEDNLYKDQIEAYWKDKPVRFAKMNNCVGCWWRSPLLLKKMSEEHPHKMDWFAKQEERTGNRFRSDVDYRKIMTWGLQQELSFEDFSECDSGYCGL